jgi:uncharacterized membrane protein YcaP (DUF421 family)
MAGEAIPRGDSLNFWQGQPTLTVVGWILRASVTVLWLMLVAKLMGQREIGRMNMFDFVVAITIGSVASSHLADSEVPMMGALVSVATIGALDIIFAYLGLKEPKARRISQDESITLIENGQIRYDMLAKTMVNLDDLLAGLRLKNYPNIHDVEFAFLESNGELSVIPKSQARPVTPADLGIPTEYEGRPVVLVEDGNIVLDNLERNKLTKDWLLEELVKQGAGDVSQLAAVILDTKGRLYIGHKHRKTANGQDAR